MPAAHVCVIFELSAAGVRSARRYKSSTQPRSEQQVTQVKPPAPLSQIWTQRRSAAGAYTGCHRYLSRQDRGHLQS